MNGLYVLDIGELYYIGYVQEKATYYIIQMPGASEIEMIPITGVSIFTPVIRRTRHIERPEGLFSIKQ